MPKTNSERSPLDGLNWVLDQPVEGQHKKKITLDWTFSLGNKERISDPKHSMLLSEFQNFFRTALEGSYAGVRMEPGTAWGAFAGIQELARFMWEKRLTTITQLTSDQTWAFVEYVRNNYELNGQGGGRRRKLTYASASKILHPLTQIHTLRIVLRRKGYRTLPEAPYSGKATEAVVTRHLKLKKTPPHKPIPDEVAIPTMSRAATWVMVGARDVIRLQSRFLDLVQGVDNADERKKAMEIARKEITDFQFTIDQRTGKPWHSPVTPAKRRLLDGKVVTLTVIQGLRRLVQDLVSACIICIQSATGLRAHEFIGLRTRHTTAGRLTCIESRLSADGLMEIFAFSGLTAKGEEAQHVWTAGLCPVGADALPVPILAAQVLDELLRPWRELSGDDHLLLTFSAAKALPRKASSIGRFTGPTLTRVQREFALTAFIESGLSWKEAKKRCGQIRGQRWRTTFAHAVFRTSPKLLGALRDHFRHMSELITDQGYIGNDASLLANLEDERVQATARTLLQITHGIKMGAGGVQRLINKHKGELALEISQMPGKSDLEQAKAYVVANDIRIWTGSYASCLINIMPGASRCNPDAELSPGFAKPDYANRSPGICASCNCCIILPEHRDFWEARLDQNARIVDAEHASAKYVGGRSVAERRLAQSRSVLRSISQVDRTTCDGVSGAHA